MIRFAWLQSRTQTLVTAAALVLLAVALWITGLQLTHLYRDLIPGCAGGAGSCDAAGSLLMSHDQLLQGLLMLLMRAVPIVIGVFWGAPLLTRELEAGTHRLVWTQSVSRARWVTTKLGLLTLVTVVLAGLLTWTVTWWFRPLDLVNRNQFGVFDARDLVPVGYAVFALTLGTFVGAVVRRTLPAMAITLGLFVAVRVAVILWVRPRLLPPAHETASLLDRGLGFVNRSGSLSLRVSAGNPPNAWLLSSHLVDSSGHVATAAERAAFLHQYCPDLGTPSASPAVFDACTRQAAKAFQLAVTYQPAGHYWPMQWLETGIFLFLGLLAALGTYWWVTRRS